MYSYDGSGYGSTGILFHAHRLIMAESMTACRVLTVSTGGTWNIFQGSATTAFNILDTACLFGLGAEYPGIYAVYHFVPQALGANGYGGTTSAATGGNYLAAHFATAAVAGATPAACGAGMYVQAGTSASVFSAQGVIQAHSTQHTAQSMYLDLVNTGTNNNTWQPAGFYADDSLTTETPATSSTDTAGFVPRNLWVWASVTTSGQLVTQNTNPYAASGNLAGWSTYNGSIQAASPLPGTAPPQPSGVLFNASGTAPDAHAYSGSFTCTAGTQYQITGTLYLSTLYEGSVGVDWYNTSGTYISTSDVTVGVDATTWTSVTCLATAPSGAVTGKPWSGVAAESGDVPSSLNCYIAGIAVIGNVPTPQQSWTGPVTSTLMNGPSGPVQALTLLNNPPALRVSQALTTSLTTATPTTVPFTVAGTTDTYSAFGTATSAYTAPLAGLYLTFPTISFASNGTGARYAGLSVTSGTVTTALQGPAYAASGAGAMSVTGVRVLDLNAGDTVKATAYQNSGGNLALGGGTWASRLCMLYLCPYSAGGVNSFTPPAAAFHWMAGFPASSIPGLLTEHLGNDLNFLVNRPYFTGYQATAQTGLTVGTWTAVTIDTVAGLIHGSAGDDYAGWSAYDNNYAAPVAGWYLVISEVYAALPSLTTGYLSAGIKVPTSGGITPVTSPDVYQTVYFPLESGPVPGAAAVGCYYLNAGETVQPVALTQGWSGSTWSTASAAATRSQFSVLWISE
jgi:hypothetical protein